MCVCVCVQVARWLYRDESRKKERTLLVKISPTEQLGSEPMNRLVSFMVTRGFPSISADKLPLVLPQEP